MVLKKLALLGPITFSVSICWGNSKKEKLQNMYAFMNKGYKCQDDNGNLNISKIQFINDVGNGISAVSITDGDGLTFVISENSSEFEEYTYYENGHLKTYYSYRTYLSKLGEAPSANPTSKMFFMWYAVLPELNLVQGYNISTADKTEKDWDWNFNKKYCGI